MLKTKSQLRSEFKKIRAELSAEEVLEKSKKINKNFLENLLPRLEKDKIFSLYNTFDNEVQTLGIAEYFITRNINFSYPKIISKDRELEFILYKKNQNLVVNKFYSSVIEPEFGEKILPNILIMPLVAFDKKLVRIGMGGGFFDRTISFLKQKNCQIVTVGLAYDLQRYEGNIQNEKHDWSLDFIVTESFIYSSN